MMSLREAVRNPAVAVAVLALAVRLVLVPLLTYDYDIYHWAQIIQNIQTGDGLYGVDGYYYTPTWGYLLAFLSLVMDAFLDVGDMGSQIVELLAVQDLSFRFHTATTVTIAFAACIKVPLVIADLLTGYLVYRFILEDTGSGRKATFGMALWLLCPTVIYMSGVQAQFDSFSALMMMLVFLLVRRDRDVLAGMVLAAGTLLKFFPAFTMLVLVAYVLCKHRGDGTGAKRVLAAVAGAVTMAAVMYLPIILEGDLATSLTFVTGRTDDMQDFALEAVLNYLLIGIALLGMVVFGYLMYRTPREEADRRLPVYMLMALALSMLISATPQYMLVMLPFLIIVMMCHDGRMRLPWILITAGSILSAVANNNVLLLDGASAYLGLVSPEWILSAAGIFDATVGGITVTTWLCSAGQALEYVGFILVPLIWYGDTLEARLPRLSAALRKIKRWDCE